MNDLSPAFYGTWSRNDLIAEAARLGVVNIDRLNGNLLIDAVYNAELRRRQAELEKAEAAGQTENPPLMPPPEPEVDPLPDYDGMTVAALRELALARGLDEVENAKLKKNDLIDMLQVADMADVMDKED